MIWAAVEGATAGKVDGFNCLPARPSKTGKAMKFGIQHKISNLLKFCKLLLTSEMRKKNKYVHVYKLVSAKGNLVKNKQVGGVKFRSTNTYLNRSQKPTANDINPMMTIPRVSLSLLETAERACPPMMQFRIR